MTESRWMRLNIDWDDSPWLFTLSAESQLAWIKLLCHVKRDGRAGTVKALATIVAAKKWGVGEEAVVKLLQAAVNDGALESNGETWVITNWDKYQDVDRTANERQRRRRAKQKESNKGGDNPESVTECHAVTPVTTRNDCHVTETETETKEKNIKKEKFRPPSVEDVQGYAAERDLVDDPSLEAEKFVAYHTSRGWVVGRNPMRDWRAAWRTWEINNRKSAGEQPRRRHFA